MNTQLEWLITGRVLYAARSGPESVPALDAFTGQVVKMLDQEGRPPVHVIWNMSGLEVDGVDRREATQFLYRIMNHPRVRWFVVVDPGVTGLRRRLVPAVMRLMGIRWRPVDSRDEALAFLQKADRSLELPAAY